MKNLIGLSFSVENITFANFLQNEQQLTLDHIGSNNYPFPFEENQFTNIVNVAPLADCIIDTLKNYQLNKPSISISLESNLPTLKRIALPNNVDEKEELEQIDWALMQSLSSPLDDYIYLRTQNQFITESYKDILVIAIKKMIVNFFQEFSSYGKISLDNLSVNQLSAEICYINTVEEQKDGIVILFKIAKNRIETTFILNGNFYISHYERIPRSQNSLNLEEIFINIVTSKIKQIETLLEQFSKKNIPVNELYFYGENTTDEIIQLVQRNVSVPVSRLNPLVNLSVSERLKDNLPSDNELSKYVECIGVALDVGD